MKVTRPVHCYWADHNPGGPHRIDSPTDGRKAVNIITNWQPRTMLALHELDAKHQQFFDYVDGDDSYTPRFVQYKGEVHDTHDTQTIDPVKLGEDTSYVGLAIRAHPGSPLCLFDSVESDSFFSGLLYKFVGEDQVIVARYFT